MTSTRLELDDIQSILVGSYPKLRAASYVMLSVQDPARARKWVGDLSSRARKASEGAPDTGPCVNVAFTFTGLEKLGLVRQALGGFSRELQEGIWNNERRRRILGDVGPNDPDGWRWGGANNPAIDILLMLFAGDDGARRALFAQERDRFEQAGLTLIEHLFSNDLGGKEHFGFRDGLSQPRLKSITRSRDEAQVVSDGEFVLGYANAYNQYTSRPLVDPIHDPEGILPDDVCSGAQHDFGKNGSYLVFRQLEQDVARFWEFIEEETASAADPNPDARELLAAKIVGRWRSGAPLVRTSTHDDPQHSDDNAFRYHNEDPDGMGCPIGSHVRRANPRDSLQPKPGSSRSLASNSRHRILRRGRTYGPPLADSLEPEDFLRAARDGNASHGLDDTKRDASRGLLFLCLNGNISRQFEFVQNVWINSPTFARLRREPDPLVGYKTPGNDSFSIPGEPVRTRVDSIPNFVRVVGGAYFFLPGIRALQFLARDPKPLASAYSAPPPGATCARPSFVEGFMRLSNRVVMRAMYVLRRQPFAAARDVFDVLFRDALVHSAQFLINIRRQHEGLDLGEERLLPREEELAQRITESMTHFLYTHYRNGVAERAGNTKTYGLVKARFIVDGHLADEHRVGVFQPGAEYPAYVRFGGPGPLVTPDIRNNGILSIGVKLMGVPGEKLLDDEAQTQDFSGISSPTFTTPNVIENLKLQRHIYEETDVFYFINLFDSHFLDALMQGAYSKSHGSPLDLRYWSCVPYAFGGGRAFQYTFVPRPHAQSKVPWVPEDDYLRSAMVRVLAREPVDFDFNIQTQTDAHQMPIENASVIWPSRLSPWIRVARLHIPAQRFDSEGQLAFARRISVNPWHSIPEHRPLGNQNRARKYVYLETSKVRQRINAEPRVEPTGDEEFE